MEGVDHVHVVQIGGGGLIGQVHRVLQGQVPDGEGLVLAVTGVDAALVLLVELAQAGGHLAAAGAGGGDHHKAPLRLNVVVLAEALLRHDQGDVGGVVRDDIVLVHPDAQGLQALDELVRNGLAPVVGDDHAADVKPDAPERVDQAQGVVVIGDAQVAPALAALNVVSGNGDDDLRLVLHLQQHLHLAVRRKARQHPGGVEIIKELAAEFQVQLAAELGDAVADILGLELHIFFVVKTKPVHLSIPNCKIYLFFSNAAAYRAAQSGAGAEIFHGAAHLFSMQLKAAAVGGADVEVAGPTEGHAGDLLHRQADACGQLQMVLI